MLLPERTKSVVLLLYCLVLVPLLSWEIFLRDHELFFHLVQLEVLDTPFQVFIMETMLCGHKLECSV